MKSLMLFILMSFSAVSFANTTVQAEGADSSSIILEVVQGIHQKYSPSAELEAKVVELLVGDGMNATRMVLVLKNGYGDSKVFELGEMIEEVQAVRFTSNNLVTIYYKQTTFNGNDEAVIVERNLTVKVAKNADGSLSDSLTVLK